MDPSKEKYSVRSVLNDPAPETEAAMKKKAPTRTPLEQAKKWAMDYLARPHSEKELRDRLEEKGCAEEDIETTVALCLDYGFLDDEAYAAMVVRHYASRGYGPGRIRTEFRRRGIPQDLWEDALEELPEGTENIDRILAARMRGRDPNDRKERDKAANALFRKGYDWDDIHAAMDRYREQWEEEYDEDEDG